MDTNLNEINESNNENKEQEHQSTIVQDALNEHLDVKFPTIEGLKPSQVLSELAPDIYNAHLEQFIYEFIEKKT